MKEIIQEPTYMVNQNTGEITHYLENCAVNIISLEADENNQKAPYFKVIDLQGAFNKVMKDLKWIEELKDTPTLIYVVLVLSRYLEAETNYLKYKNEYLGRKHIVKLFNISESLASRYIKILKEKKILAYTKDKDGVKCLCVNPKCMFNGRGVITATLNEFKDKEKK